MPGKAYDASKPVKRRVQPISKNVQEGGVGGVRKVVAKAAETVVKKAAKNANKRAIAAANKPLSKGNTRRVAETDAMSKKSLDVIFNKASINLTKKEQDALKYAIRRGSSGVKVDWHK